MIGWFTFILHWRSFVINLLIKINWEKLPEEYKKLK